MFFVFPQIWYSNGVYQPLPFTPQPDDFCGNTILLGLPWASPLFPLRLVPRLFRLQKAPLVSHVVLRRPQVNSFRVSSKLTTWFLGVWCYIYVYITCMSDILCLILCLIYIFPETKQLQVAPAKVDGWNTFFRFRPLCTVPPEWPFSPAGKTHRKSGWMVKPTLNR